MVVNFMLQKKLKDFLSKNENVINEKNIDEEIQTKLDEIKQMIKNYSHESLNQDIQLSEFKNNSLNKRDIFLYFNTLNDQTIIENRIINTLLTNPNRRSKIENIIANTCVEKTTKVNTSIQEVNTGDSVLFLEDSKQAYPM